MNVAQLLVERLEQAGVRWVFGVPSGPVLPLIEALRLSRIEFVLTASETSAGFMATVVGHLTGRPGVCVATLGPGATNLATGVGAAWLDRAPVLAITCNVATAWLDRRVQMRIDHHALFSPLTKASWGLRAQTAAQTLDQAIETALGEPPGPVHLDLPEDAALASPPGGPTARAQPPRPARSLRPIENDLLAAVASALQMHRRPLVVVGLTFARSRAAPALLAFIQRHHLPFVTTLHAKGCLPESHPLWCGVIGRARRSDVQAFVERADAVLAFGYDPVEINYEEWVGARPVFHVSTEEAEAGPDLNLALNLGGDLDAALARLAELPSTRSAWTSAEIHQHRRRLERALRPAGYGFAPHQALDVLRERLPADGILAMDVGAHTHQVGTQWRTDAPATLLATNGWSSMGFGLPAGYAAKLVHPERPVVAVVGDGGFQMAAGELALARRRGLAVPAVVLNDGWLGLMKVKQERRGYPLHGVRLGDPPPSPQHYFGVPCRPARDADELADALGWAFALDGPSVIETFVNAEAYSATVYD